MVDDQDTLDAPDGLSHHQELSSCLSLVRQCAGRRDLTQQVFLKARRVWLKCEVWRASELVVCIQRKPSSRTVRNDAPFGRDLSVHVALIPDRSPDQGVDQSGCSGDRGIAAVYRVDIDDVLLSNDCSYVRCERLEVPNRYVMSRLARAKAHLAADCLTRGTRGGQVATRTASQRGRSRWTTRRFRISAFLKR